MWRSRSRDLWTETLIEMQRRSQGYLMMEIKFRFSVTAVADWVDFNEKSEKQTSRLFSDDIAGERFIFCGKR
jgi:hypothetical protein